MIEQMNDYIENLVSGIALNKNDHIQEYQAENLKFDREIENIETKRQATEAEAITNYRNKMIGERDSIFFAWPHEREGYINLLNSYKHRISVIEKQIDDIAEEEQEIDDQIEKNRDLQMISDENLYFYLASQLKNDPNLSEEERNKRKGVMEILDKEYEFSTSSEKNEFLGSYINVPEIEASRSRILYLESELDFLNSFPESDPELVNDFIRRLSIERKGLMSIVSSKIVDLTTLEEEKAIWKTMKKEYEKQLSDSHKVRSETAKKVNARTEDIKGMLENYDYEIENASVKANKDNAEQLDFYDKAISSYATIKSDLNFDSESIKNDIASKIESKADWAEIEPLYNELVNAALRFYPLTISTDTDDRYITILDREKELESSIKSREKKLLKARENASKQDISREDIEGIIATTNAKIESIKLEQQESQRINGQVMFYIEKEKTINETLSTLNKDLESEKDPSKTAETTKKIAELNTNLETISQIKEALVNLTMNDRQTNIKQDKKLMTYEFSKELLEKAILPFKKIDKEEKIIADIKAELENVRLQKDKVYSQLGGKPDEIKEVFRQKYDDYVKNKSVEPEIKPVTLVGERLFTDEERINSVLGDQKPKNNPITFVSERIFTDEERINGVLGDQKPKNSPITFVSERISMNQQDTSSITPPEIEDVIMPDSGEALYRPDGELDGASTGDEIFEVLNRKSNENQNLLVKAFTKLKKALLIGAFTLAPFLLLGGSKKIDDTASKAGNEEISTTSNTLDQSIPEALSNATDLTIVLEEDPIEKEFNSIKVGGSAVSMHLDVIKNNCSTTAAQAKHRLYVSNVKDELSEKNDKLFINGFAITDGNSIVASTKDTDKTIQEFMQENEITDANDIQVLVSSQNDEKPIGMGWYNADDIKKAISAGKQVDAIESQVSIEPTVSPVESSIRR